MMLLKMPLLTMWKANCVDGIPNMTSIKSFHSPESQNNSAALPPQRNLFTLFVITNANIEKIVVFPSTGKGADWGMF